MANFQEVENIIWPIIWKKERCKKKDCEGIHDRFLRDDVFPSTNDWKQSRWTSLSSMGCSCRWRPHLSYVTRRILLLQEQLIGGSTSISRAMTPQPLRKRSDFKQALSIEFLLYLVAMARFLVVCLRIQRKSRKMRQAKACDWSGQLVIYRTLAKNLRRMAFKNSFHFVTARSFTADGGLL